MSHIISYIVTLVILAATVLGMRLYLKKSESDQLKVDNDIIKINKHTVQELIVIFAKSINKFLKQDYSAKNYNEKTLNNKNKAKANLRQASKNAGYGDKRAKMTMKEYAKNVISTNNILRVTEENIDEFIPFSRPEDLSSQDKFFLIMEGYRQTEGKKCLSKMFSDFHFDDKPEITDEMVNEAYDIACDPEECRKLGIPENLVDLDYLGKLSYLSQEVYQGYKGFGVADRLFDTDVDEIDAGVSGIPAGFDSFEISNEFAKKVKYSYDSIWILLHGRNIHLSCLSFGTEEELERICSNVYKYNAQKVFSRNTGFVVSSMKDGSRVVVTRPPFSDKWAFYVRKFDSASAKNPEDLITGEGSEIPLFLCEWMVRGHQNTAITGQQGTGKTTMLKAFFKWIDNLNIRTQEIAFEMNLSFTYPDKNISSFQVTDGVSAQAGLNVQKKTNGAVNIVGEVADAEQASHVIQTANVASLFAMFTHHAKETASLVNMIALNLLQLGLYKEKRDAVEIAAKTLNVDVHLELTKGYRHIDRITEIIPIEEQLYPSEKIESDGDEYTEAMLRRDTREYYKRQTDRKMFETNTMCHWNRIPGDPNPRHGYFTLDNMPSPEMIEKIHSVLVDPADDDKFSEGLEHIKKLSDELKDKHKNDGAQNVTENHATENLATV